MTDDGGNPSWLRSGLLSDAMDQCGLPANAAGGFRLLGRTRAAIGHAVTMRQSLWDGQPGQSARQGEIALAAPAGAVLVIAMPEGCGIATWGEGHTLRAMTARLAGVVIGVAARDAAALAGRDLPVLCAGTSPLRSKDRLVTVETGAPVTVAGVRIAPGDLVCFDEDGLAAVPAAHEAEVLKAAEAILHWEAARDRELQARLGQG